MRYLLLRILIFISPLLVLVLIAEIILYSLGESRDVRSALLEQRGTDKKNVLYMRGVLEQDFNVYKMAGLEIWQPDIMVLGSSRVMQFRDLHFNKEYSFYNAGGILQCVEDFEKMVDLLEKNEIKKPRLLIIGLDLWWFKKDGLPNSTWLDKENLTDDALDFRNRMGGYKRFYTKFNDLHNLKFSDNIGSYAKSTNGGFRTDGSKAYENDWILRFIEMPEYHDRENPPVIDRILESKTNRFTISPTDSNRIQIAIESIRRIQKMKVDLLVYFPPFSNESWLALDSMRVYTELIQNVKFLSERIESLDSNVIKSTAPMFYNLGDEYFIDGFHPGEVFLGIQLESFWNMDNPNRKYLSRDLDSLNLHAISPLTYEYPTVPN